MTISSELGERSSERDLSLQFVRHFDRLSDRKAISVPELVECEETFCECFDSEAEKNNLLHIFTP